MSILKSLLKDDRKSFREISRETGKSYVAGNDKISHQNAILDSIIGENVWFGGYSGTANVLLNQGNIRHEISEGNLINTGTNQFGAVVGNDCAIGALVIILPARHDSTVCLNSSQV